LENEVFELSNSAKLYVQQKKDNFHIRYTLQIVLGIMLCILSPIFLIVISTLGNQNRGDAIATAILLFMIAIAVFLFIAAGTEMEGYKQLLQVEDYKPEKKQENKVVSAVAAVIWPLTVIAYLIWSFTTNDWAFTWIIWPVVGIAFGAFSAVVNIVTNK